MVELTRREFLASSAAATLALSGAAVQVSATRRYVGGAPQN